MRCRVIPAERSSSARCAPRTGKDATGRSDRGAEPDARAQAKVRFLDPLYAHLDHAGLDHLSEIADGDAPHTPAGTPFQAWSLGELLRIENLLARLGPIAA